MATQGAGGLNHLLEGPEDAPVLVLSNSPGTTLGMWDDQASALREHFRLPRYDHRDHGDSPAPPGPYEIDDLGRDVLSLLDGLGIVRASFCGLSVGGMVGMWLASEAPERFERLVLCRTAARLAPEAWQTRSRTVREEGVGAVADAVVERWFTPGFRASRPETLAWAGRTLRETNAEGYAGCCEAIRDMDLRDGLGRITEPTLVAAAAEDPAILPEHGEIIRDAVPDAGFEVIPNAAHLANVEKPEAVTRATLGHLKPVAREGR